MGESKREASHASWRELRGEDSDRARRPRGPGDTQGDFTVESGWKSYSNKRKRRVQRPKAERIRTVQSMTEAPDSWTISYTHKREKKLERWQDHLTSLKKKNCLHGIYFFTSLWISRKHSGQKFAMSSELSLAMISPRILEELGSPKRMSLRALAASAQPSLHCLHNSQKLQQEDVASGPLHFIRFPWPFTQMSISCSVVKLSKRDSKLRPGISSCSIDNYQQGWGLQQNRVWHFRLDFALNKVCWSFRTLCKSRH